jgi:hypothetical protein
MGILDNLLNRNPTRDWKLQEGLDLVLDLDEETFAGVPVGEKAERLQVFGPSPDAESARAGMFNYPAGGFQVSAELGVFVEVEMAFAGGEGARAFGGKVKRHGRSVVLTGQSSEADLVALLGAPYERKDEPADDDIPAHATLSWHGASTDVVADFETGTLSLLWVGTKN